MQPVVKNCLSKNTGGTFGVEEGGPHVINRNSQDQFCEVKLCGSLFADFGRLRQRKPTQQDFPDGKRCLLTAVPGLV